MQNNLISKLVLSVGNNDKASESIIHLQSKRYVYM